MTLLALYIYQPSLETMPFPMFTSIYTNLGVILTDDCDHNVQAVNEFNVKNFIFSASKNSPFPSFDNH